MHVFNSATLYYSSTFARAGWIYPLSATMNLNNFNSMFQSCFEEVPPLTRYTKRIQVELHLQKSCSIYYGMDVGG